MSDNLDVIIVDDDPTVCEVITSIVKRFYTWGEVLSFTDSDEAVDYCKSMDSGVAVFILDVFMGNETGFGFLDRIADKFAMAYEDTIIITGNASDDIVNMCVASDITFLIEKPIEPYALQLAVRAIIGKYLRFAKKLLSNPAFAEAIAGF
jgi:CheY-like chemotaxis protein